MTDQLINSDKQELLRLLEAKEQDFIYNKLMYMFPDTGPYRKELYPKHLEFMHKGRNHPQRLFMGANRTGKSNAGGTEMAYHLTGLYPKDWKGKEFLNPVSSWAVGVTNQSVKEVLQLALLGKINDVGSGLIPKDKIIQVTRKPGVAGAIETVYVRHKSGGISELTFKSYEQGRENFQGTKKQVIWMDEEPRDYGIYEECLMRTMDDTNPGIIYVTFTPLFGMTSLVQSFLDEGKFPDNGSPASDPTRFVTRVAWDEVPHLSEEQKKTLINSIAPHLRDARTKGLPNLGAGAIYPYSEDAICVDPFPIPDYWPKAYGFDVGWGGVSGQGGRTAAIWVTQNPESGTYYLYSEHYEMHSLPAVHAEAIKARGDWIIGIIDYGAKQVSPTDGKNLMEQYLQLGLNLEPAVKAKEAAIQKVGQMLLSGQLKVVNTLRNWLNEYRQYTRGEDGKVKEKQKDDLMDAMHYVILACPNALTYPPDPDAYKPKETSQRDSHTGY